MAQETPGQTAEGRLIEQAAKADGRSLRKLAANAGLSDTRLRQIMRGYQQNTAGKTIEAKASALTLARLAIVLGIEPEALAEAGREDAVRLVEGMRQHYNPGDEVSFVGAEGGPAEMVIGNAPSSAGRDVFVSYSYEHRDEIDLIYASTMSAREKLVRIRQVLELRAQAEAEERAARKEAPAEAEAPLENNHS